MKKSATLVSSVFVAFLTGLAIGYSLVNPSECEKRISDLGTEVSDLNSRVSTLEGEKSGLESQLLRLEQQLEIEVLGIYFSPKGGCEQQIIYWVSSANVSVHILVYSFTLDSISDALIEARERGVEVQIVFEKGRTTEQGGEYRRLREAGIAVRNDTNSKLMHNKIMIVDSAITLTGSFNWSNNAENYNDENLIVMESAYIAGTYEEEFKEIWNESV